MNNFNGFDSVEKQYLKIMRRSFENLKDIRTSKIILGKVRDKHELEVSRESIERLKNYIKQIDESKSRRKENPIDIRQNFFMFSHESLMQLRVDMRAMKEILLYRINNGFYTTQHEEELARREVHQINKVLAKIEEGVVKNKKRRKRNKKIKERVERERTEMQSLV